MIETKKSGRLLIIVIVLLFVAAGCASAPSEATPAGVEPAPLPEGEALVLADISDDPIETIEELQPLVDYLAAHLADFGIAEGQVKVATSIQEMADFMAGGEVDLYFDSVYPATVVSNASGAQPILRRWKGGVSEYHAVLFASTESGITSIDDLPGHRIAFEEDFSTSGYVLPLSYLIEHGLTAVELNSPDSEAPANRVGFVFSGDHDNTLQWVVSGRLEAGATEDGDFEEVPEDVKSQLVVLAETGSVPRHIGIVSPDMEPELRDAIVDVLVTAHGSAEGRAALEAFGETAQFDEFPEGIDVAIARMNEMYRIVQENQ